LLALSEVLHGGGKVMPELFYAPKVGKLMFDTIGADLENLVKDRPGRSPESYIFAM
jgi:hypothetical protein